MNKRIKMLRDALYDARRCGDGEDQRELVLAIEAEEARLESIDDGLEPIEASPFQWGSGCSPS